MPGQLYEAFKVINDDLLKLSLYGSQWLISFNALKTEYVGHPISSDNCLISQKMLLKSEFYYPLHVAMGVAYSCLKYGVFIIT